MHARFPHEVVVESLISIEVAFGNANAFNRVGEYLEAPLNGHITSIECDKIGNRDAFRQRQGLPVRTSGAAFR